MERDNQATDLVARLRGAKMAASGAGDIGVEAADEIERLRAKIVILENDLGWWRDGFQKVASPLPAGK